MTWSWDDPDGRATWQWIEIDGEPAILWRRVGTHAALALIHRCGGSGVRAEG